MRLILKHLTRSIGKKPLQPMILILTLTLSIATTIFAFTIEDMIDDDVKASQALKYGNATLMVSVGNSSESRFLFADDVADVLGESAKVAGLYELPLILDSTGDTTIAVATEFDRISDVFDIEFLKYGKVTKASVKDVAFISADFAEEMGLSIGDSLTVETMGYDKTYRIEGISEHPFMDSYDVMVDISGVVRAFADNSLLFAAIGEDFKPCGKIYVNIDNCEGMTQTDAVARLKADERFAQKNFEDLRDIEERNSNSIALNVAIRVSVALAAVLSAVIAFCCLYILAKERAEENLILAYSGASPKALGMLKFAEVIAYWAVALPLGVLAATPITRMIAMFVDLRYTEPSIHSLTVVKSALIIFGICLLTTTFFLILNKRIKRNGTTRTEIKARWAVWLLLFILAALAVLYISPAALKIKLYAVVIAANILLIFLATPLILRLIARAIDKKMQNDKREAVIAFRYALKNICSLKLLHNIARLSALIVSIILIICLVFSCARGWMRGWEQVFDADYIVYNATDSCYEKTAGCESAASVYHSYMNQSEIGMVVSADELSAYGEILSIKNQPRDNEVIVSVGISHKLDLSVGDSFSLELDGVEYELTVAEIVRVGINYVAINCEDLGIPYNMLLVEGREGVSSSELLADLSQSTSTELAAISSIDALMEQRISSIKGYINTGKVLIGVFVIFSLIGMVNTFCESLRTRREEFGFYCLAGMSRKNLRLLKFSELVVAILLGILIGMAAFVLAALAVNGGMSGYGVEIFLGAMRI